MSYCVICGLENARLPEEEREEIFTCADCGDQLCGSCLVEEANRFGIEMHEASLICDEETGVWHCPECHVKYRKEESVVSSLQNEKDAQKI